jgi:hypothetical protein
MGLRPGPDRPNEGGFLGHPQEETFWEDAFDLVHKDDLPLLWFLVSLVMEEPGASESVEELVDHRGQPIGAVDESDVGGAWEDGEPGARQTSQVAEDATAAQAE